ncbi:hypothetical protein GALL_441260 [mine drainage metagenome]|uniref:Uncharacterized protein n=1 Tax=mine drainage metagenome TaxID=410659 RepID=A0A1J5PRJ7_9ZZZZ
MAGIDALVLGDDDLAVLVDQVETRDLALEVLGHEFQQRAVVHQLQVVEGEEVRQDLLGVQADGLEQDGDRHLAPAVHAEIQDVLGIELEVEPGTAVGNDARREQQLARAVGLALVVLEEHAGRAMQLADDDALGAVDDERALVGHERDLAHIDLLLLHFLDRGLGRLAVHHDQPHLGAQRRGEGQTALLAFPHVEHRACQGVAVVFHAHVLVVRHDGENGAESGLQALVLALRRREIFLQKGLVRVDLRGQQIGDIQDALAAAKTFPNALFLSERVGHGYAPLHRDKTSYRIPRGKPQTMR